VALGLPLLAIILAMVVLVGLAIAVALYRKRVRRPDPGIADILRAHEIPVEMIGGPDCGCLPVHDYTELNRTKN
jgi:hypothetical protein